MTSAPSDEVFDDYMQGGTEMTPSDTGVRPTKRLSDEEEVEEEEAEPAELEPTVELVVLCECGRYVCGERRGASGSTNKPSTTVSSRFGYRADVDGLRAVSVIAVTLESVGLIITLGLTAQEGREDYWSYDPRNQRIVLHCF